MSGQRTRSPTLGRLFVLMCFENVSRHHHDKNEISWIALGDWGGQSVETIEPFHLIHEMPWQVYTTPKGRVPIF